MQGVSRGAWTRRLLRVPIAGVAVLLLAPTPAEAASSPTGSSQVVAPAGHLNARLLAPPAAGHRSTTRSDQQLRTMHSDALKTAKERASGAASPSRAVTAQTAPAAAPTGAVFNGLNKPGLSAADEGSAATPPDSTGAIGPTLYVEMVNQLVGVYDRNTLSLISSTDFGTFAHVPAGLGTSDPQIQWDPVANRWLYAMVGIATGGNYLLFGWTKTADPSNLTGGWCNYGVNTTSNLQDYPKLGHDAHWLTIGSNVYSDTSSSYPFVTAQIWAFPKPAATDSTCSSGVNATFFADAAHPLKNSDGTLSFTPVPANTTDSSNDYIISARDVTLAPAAKVMVWHMEARPAPTLVADGDLAVGSYAIPPSVPQPGTPYLLDSLDGRLTQAVARFDPSAGAEAVWSQQTIGRNGRSVVRWYEFIPASKTVRQQGELASPTDFLWNAAISPSAAGNDAAIFYNRGSASQLPLIGALTRTSTTQLGQMEIGETILGTSSAPNEEAAFQTNCNPNPCRWGDYSGATPDPVNSHVVWGSNQITGPVFFGYAQWTTQNFAISTVPPAPDFSLSASPTSQSVIQGASTSYTISVARVGGFSDALRLTVSGLPAGAGGTFSPNPVSGAASTLTLTTATTTPVGTYTLTISGTNGTLTHTTTATLVVTAPPPPDFSLAASPSSQTIFQGAATSYTISVTRINGFSDALSLTVSGLPAGAAGTFSPNPTTGVRSTLNVTTASTTPAGFYSLTISGTNGTLTRSTGVTLVVTAPPDYSLSASPGSQTIVQGGSTSYTIYVTPIGGFASAVTLTVSGLPSGATGSFSPNPVTGTSSTLSLTTSAGVPIGTYSLTVSGTGGGLTRTASATLVVNSPVPCSSASLSPASATIEAGATIHFTASSSGCSNPQYEYWVHYLDGSWNMLRPFSADPTWDWNTSGLAPGTYQVNAWANQTGNSTALSEAIGSSMVTLTGCTSASLSPSSTTTVVGSTVHFSATSSGCSNPQYEYWVQALDGTWSIQRPFSASPTWDWVTSGLAPGTYHVNVWANQAGASIALSETIGSSTVTLGGSCTSASLAPSSVSAPLGSTVAFSATSSGCSNPQYQYWVQFLDGTWRIQRPFSADPTWSWVTSGLAPGTYHVNVWANQAGDSTALAEAIGSSTVTLNGCASASLSPASMSAPLGSTVHFSASSTGCSNPQYQFWVQSLDGTWSIQRPFSADPTWNWATSGLAPGTYHVNVWANQAGDSTALAEAIGSSTVTLIGCASASLSPAGVTQQVTSTVHFSASSSGCSNPQYEYWVQYLDGSWNMLRAFSATPSWGWVTSGLAPGTYHVNVWANQTGDSTALAEAIGSSTVTLTGCTSASLSPSSTTVQAGSTVHFSATSSGCSNPQYEYWVQALDGTWSMQRPFSTDPTWNWVTSGLAPGTYHVNAWANQAGASTALSETIGSSTVTLGGNCASAGLAPSSVSAPLGSTVAFSASSSGCSNPQYQYWVHFLDGTWRIQRPFSPDPTWSWVTSGLAPGTYQVNVWANQAGDSTALAEAIGSSFVTLTGGCASASITPASVSVTAGSTVTLTASSTGCSSPVYQFWLQDTNGNWQVMQAFSTSNTWVWNTAGWPRGIYNIRVWANQQGADLSTWEGNGAATVTLT